MMLSKKWFFSLIFISTATHSDVNVIDTHVSKKPLMLELTIENTSPSAVARGYIATRFKTPGREVPWIDSWEQSYSVPGGVEPGERYNLQLPAPPELQEITQHEITAEVYFFSAFNYENAPLNADAEYVVQELERHERESQALQAELKEMMNR
ncbi:hypothetical protein [Vreelandella venusta]|uniref:hypothetical protein n=1 Tax=Vreelandella venusta TaxID=44935 RepID=UPI00200DEA41|nr:hypothetical protein [Halomonas venusta]UQI42527.1 hypothetical protein M3L73_09785 [Halomonas venusta]